jgi:hypothetical protein
MRYALSRARSRGLACQVTAAGELSDRAVAGWARRVELSILATVSRFAAAVSIRAPEGGLAVSIRWAPAGGRGAAVSAVAPVAGCRAGAKAATCGAGPAEVAERGVAIPGTDVAWASAAVSLGVPTESLTAGTLASIAGWPPGVPVTCLVAVSDRPLFSRSGGQEAPAHTPGKLT